MTNTFDNKSYSSALTLSAAVDLVSAVVTKVIGNDVSSVINGEKVNASMVETIAANRIVNNLPTQKYG